MATILYPIIYGHGKHNDLDFTDGEAEE